MAQLDNFFRRGRVVFRAAPTHHTLIGQSIASNVRFGSPADLFEATFMGGAES